MTSSDSTTASVLRRRAAAGALWLPTSGESMGHRYPSGSRVLIRASHHRPRIGHVWAFVDDDDRLVVHRCVWNRSTATLRFRGDSVCRLDASVPMGSLVGPVTLVDDGTHQWPPRRWHAVGPTARALVRAVRICIQRFRSHLSVTFASKK